MAGRDPTFAKGQALITIDQESQIFVLVAKMREVMGQAGRSALKSGHSYAIAFERDRFKRLAGLNQGINNLRKRRVQLCGHLK